MGRPNKSKVTILNNEVENEYDQSIILKRLFISTYELPVIILRNTLSFNPGTHAFLKKERVKP